MLDRHELLPEEQVHPDIIEKLRAAYRMKPEEEQALFRVRERLAQSSHALPLLDAAQSDEHADHLEILPISLSSNIGARRKWSRLFNALAAAIVVALLVGSLAFAFAITGHTKVGLSAGTTNDIRVVLAAEKGSRPTMTEMEATATLLLQRSRAFGLEGTQAHVITEKGRLEILLELPHIGGDEQGIITTVIQKGSLAFWSTGSTPLQLGATFNPAQFVQYNPGGKPLFTNRNLDPNAFAIVHDPAGRPQISCIMQGQALRSFQAFTGSHIGTYLTVTLDGTVFESAVIESAIAGPFVLSSDLTEQQVKAIIVVVSHGPLPVELQRVS